MAKRNQAKSTEKTESKFAFDRAMCERLKAVKTAMGWRARGLTPFMYWIFEEFCKAHEKGRVVRGLGAVEGEGQIDERKQAS